MISLVRTKLHRARYFRSQWGTRALLEEMLRVSVWLPKLVREAAVWRQAGRSGAAAKRREFLDKPFGVNFIGAFGLQTGISEAARLRLLALRAAGVSIRQVDYLAGNAVEQIGLAAGPEEDYRFNLVWLTARQFLNFSGHVRQSFFEGHYNITYLTWEMPELPHDWLPALRLWDEIWVSTHFVQDAVAAASRVPVFRLPHPIVPDRLTIEKTGALRRWANLPADAFVFMFVFDGESDLQRKNPQATIEAFKLAFGPGTAAWLVIKSVRTDASQLAAMKQAAAGLNIRILDEGIPRDELDKLMADCDCYVSLHRSEGFGLTMLEAMTLGKPVIATGYGGNMDYMTPENSYLVPHRMVALEADTANFKRGSQWAEPDVEQAALRMQQVFENQEEAARIGARAKANVERQLSPERIGGMARERLEAISRS